MSGMDGVVLQTYGSGNVPSRRKDILGEASMRTGAPGHPPFLPEVLKASIDNGTIILNVSQCQRGKVQQAYSTGKV